MSILLKSNIFIAGVEKGPTDGTLTYGAAFEAELVNRGVAKYVGSNPAQGGLVPATYRGSGSELFNLTSSGVALFAGFGDSHTSRSFSIGSSVAAYDAQGYLPWVQALSMGKLWMPLVVKVDTGAVFTTMTNYCKGVSGNTTVDMLLRTTDITNLNPLPKYVFFLGGTNDFAVTATSGDSAQTVFNRWKIIVERFRAKGIVVVCLTLFPRGNGTSNIPWNATFTAAEVISARAKSLQFNEYMRAYCAVTSGTILVDAWRRLVNWATTTSDAIVGYTKDSDYIHTNDLSAYIVADEAIKALNPYLSAGEITTFAGSGDLYSATDNPYGSMIDGSFVTGTTGTVSAPVTAGVNGVPTNWTFNRFAGAGASTCEVQKQARPDGKGGNECKLVFAGGAGGPDSFRGYQGASTIASTNFATGDTIQGTCDVTVSATGDYAPPSLEVRMTGGSFYALRKSQVDVPGNYSMVLRTPMIVLGAGFGNANYWTVDIIGTTCAATVTRRNMALRKISPDAAGSVI